jgi:hypothetical protein
MTPSVKLHSISFGLATAIVFTIWTQLFKLTELNDFYKIIIGGLISLGIYRLIATFIVYLTTKSRWIKKKFLGQYYLEGTWVGFYIGVSGHERFLIERFEQGIDTLVIRGMSYNEQFQYQSTWTASSVNIDIVHGKISYMYEVGNINDKSNNNGIAIFNFDRDDQYSEAKGLAGFSADFHLGQRVKAKEIKISDKCSIDEQEALEGAIKLFNENKNRF